MPGPLLEALREQAAAVVVLLLILYAGYKGGWYWRSGVRILIAEISRERDDWRMVAVTLLRKQGVDLPEGFEQPRSLPGSGEDQSKR